MIPYTKKFYNLPLIFQLTGSSLYRACFPGLLSSLFYLLLLFYLRPEYTLTNEEGNTFHTYYRYTHKSTVIEVLVTGTALLIVFRANKSYARYWNACGDVYRMMSQWLDATANCSIFHLQQSHYKDMRPANYHDSFDLNHGRYFLTRDRQVSYSELSFVDKGDEVDSSGHDRNKNVGRNKGYADIGQIEELFPISNKVIGEDTSIENSGHVIRKRRKTKAMKLQEKICSRPILRQMEQRRSSRLEAVQNKHHLLQEGRLDGGWGLAFQDGKSTYYNMDDPDCEWNESDDENLQFNSFNSDSHCKHKDECGCTDTFNRTVDSFASCRGGRTPSLYLQELVHLASLCNAVAVATLRNDVEGAPLPLCKYIPGQPWPKVDPTKDPKSTCYMRGKPQVSCKGKYSSLPILGGIEDELTHTRISFRAFLMQRLLYYYQTLTRYDRSPEMRTQHNASRPISVIGGVSRNELEFLARARGPSAKVQLCWAWLSEFISREDLAGSFGEVGCPIVSRIHQFLSDGMVYYNHCRKTMSTPFPAPHAQISSIYIVAIMFCIPFLMLEYINTEGKECISGIVIATGLNFLTVSCLAGLHEVARELENPFRNVPNEIPLVRMQAIFNEALIALFAGFHPDHYWNAEDFRKSKSFVKGDIDEFII